VAAAAGVAIALSLPPFGWWPLAIVGLGIFATLLHRRAPRARTRALLGAALGLGQYAIGLWWVIEFNGAGYVALLLLGMAFTAAAAAAVASRRWLGVLVGLPAALMVSDWIRGHFPFGGLPLGGLPLGQAAGPLAPVARLGGPLLVTGVTALAGTGLAMMVAHFWSQRPKREARATAEPTAATPRHPDTARATDEQTTPVPDTAAVPEESSAAAAARPRSGASRREAVAGAGALVVVVALVLFGRFGPNGAGPGPHRTIKVAAVQGGGPRGLNASQVLPGVPFQRQLDATATIHGPVDLVVWPEDVVSVGQPVAQTAEGAMVGQLAVRLHATVVAGVVEDVGQTQFRNAAVAWSPTGVIVARYDKVHRVPFGEYIPARSFFQHIANLSLVPRDAIAGHGPGLLDTPAGQLGVVISFEVFFEDRARAGINAGGQVLIVPTNASSYSTSQVPTQEVAAAQLRAWETGREVLQAAPTGYSALIDADGHVLQRTTLGAQQVLIGRLTLRNGRTVFMRLGDIPFLLLAIVGLAAASQLAHHPG